MEPRDRFYGIVDSGCRARGDPTSCKSDRSPSCHAQTRSRRSNFSWKWQSNEFEGEIRSVAGIRVRWVGHADEGGEESVSFSLGAALFRIK